MEQNTVIFDEKTEKDFKFFAKEVAIIIKDRLREFLIVDNHIENSRFLIIKKYKNIFSIWKYRAKKLDNIPEWRAFCVFVNKEKTFYVHIIYPRTDYNKQHFKNLIDTREKDLYDYYLSVLN